MKTRIRWTPKSVDTFEEIIFFLHEQWTEEIVEQFVEDIFSTIDIISKFPLMFKTIQDTSIRKGLINKHVSLYYKIHKKDIELLYFWDNRKNPIDNKY